MLRVTSYAPSSNAGSTDQRQASPLSPLPPGLAKSPSHAAAAATAGQGPLRSPLAADAPAPAHARVPAPTAATHTLHDVPAEVFDTMCGEDDDEFLEYSLPMPAVSQRSNHSQLVTALLDMATASPVEPIAGRYPPTGELTNAGQALVAYARVAGDELALKCALPAIGET